MSYQNQLSSMKIRTNTRSFLNVPFPFGVGWMRVVVVWSLILLGTVEKGVDADDLFNFANFQLPDDWGTLYSTCTRTDRDVFREPRTELKPDNLRAPFESLSPVPIVTKDVEKSPTNITLHIYSNPGVRNGYSVSYGFQKDKECLHGQDSECVVSPDFGRVRALVVNANRFKQGENLNFIKDHFLIEEPEKFVTILNGGSIYERKFYEAVFLGGYSKRKNPSRSSHTIDGKPFPLEIYMYFVDETVPSMTLTTIVVVLVEESKKDNPYVKPIVNAVKSKLYDAERRYVETNRANLRREKLYHHLRESLQFNPFQKDILKDTESIIFHKSLAPSSVLESEFANFYESFERLQALSAELQFHDEDLEQIEEIIFEKEDEIKKQLLFYTDRVPRPYEYFVFKEQVFMAQIAFLLATRHNYLNESDPLPQLNSASKALDQVDAMGTYIFEKPPWNQNALQIYEDSVPRKEGTSAASKPKEKYDFPKLQNHLNDKTLPLTVDLVKFLIADLNNTQQYNDEVYSRMMLSIPANKYYWIEKLRLQDEERDDVNKKIFKHFHSPAKEDIDIHACTPAQARSQPNLPITFDFSLYKHGKRTSMRFYQNLHRLFEMHFKIQDLKKSRAKIQARIDEIWEKYSFPDEKTMRDVVRYLKYGEKDYNVQIVRQKVHDQIWEHTLPLDEKRRGFVEYKNLEMSDMEIVDTSKRNPIKVNVDQAFQISWLMPSFGGYYYYAGSSPIPPCFRAQNVIVFKQPISMSKDQIQWLTKVPVSLNKRRDIPNTTPRLWPLKFEVGLDGIGVSRQEEVQVKVFEQKRNHIFMGNDGVHPNAVELMEKRRLARERGGSRSILCGNLQNAVVAIIVFSIHFVM